MPRIPNLNLSREFEAFGSIPDRHEAKCVYGPTVLGWALTGLFLFRCGSVNTMDAERGGGCTYPAWLREVCGLPADRGAEAPCGELLRLWAGRVALEDANEILATAFETIAPRGKGHPEPERRRGGPASPAPALPAAEPPEKGKSRAVAAASPPRPPAGLESVDAGFWP